MVGAWFFPGMTIPVASQSSLTLNVLQSQPSSTKVAMPIAEAVIVMPAWIKSHMDSQNVTLKVILAMEIV